MGRHLRLILHGKAAGVPEIRQAVDAVRRRDHRLEVRVTWEAGDAVRFAREAAADGVDTVIAGGGDGTLNEVVSGVVDGSGPPNCSFGLLPLGTANDFARACGIPVENPEAALLLAAEEQARPVDLADIGGRVFLNVATGGFGTRVTVETPPEMKKWLKGVSYLLTGVGKLFEFQPEEGRLQGPDFEWEGMFLALAVGNGRQAGGGIQLCPEALLDDGLLDVMILPEIPQTRHMEVLKRLAVEGLTALEAELVHARLPWVDLIAPKGMHLNLDGEPTLGSRFHFEARKHWLRFHLPPDAPVLTSDPA
ncbi:MAG: lipid kinase YegS [Acidobacteriota bacterium]|nr:lipid kinase YegS [Acidobacteriota bacterium]